MHKKLILLLFLIFSVQTQFAMNPDGDLKEAVDAFKNNQKLNKAMSKVEQVIARHLPKHVAKLRPEIKQLIRKYQQSRKPIDNWPNCDLLPFANQLLPEEKDTVKIIMDAFHAFHISID